MKNKSLLTLVHFLFLYTFLLMLFTSILRSQDLELLQQTVNFHFSVDFSLVSFIIAFSSACCLHIGDFLLLLFLGPGILYIPITITVIYTYNVRDFQIYLPPGPAASLSSRPNYSTAY